MQEADALIVSSPVYIDNITGQMKVFFDRLADAIHYRYLQESSGAPLQPRMNPEGMVSFHT